MTSYLTTESIEPEDEADETIDDSGVTYFVDDDGRYYYQPNTAEGDEGIVALDVENVPKVEEQPQPQPMENVIVPDGNYTQTVTLVPSENADGEITYVLVVADDNKDLVNLNLNMEVDQNEEQMDPTAGEVVLELEEEEVRNESDQKRAAEPDVYKFEDDEEVSEEASEEEEEEDKKVKLIKKKSRKRASNVVVRQTRLLFTCTFCKYSSHRRYLLVRHMKSHSDERPYKCCVCERGFKTQASLQNHLNMHNGVKPHSCNFCDSTFTTSGELVRHVRYKHTHEKPHKCSECDYASVELSKLRRHVRCHTGERPYQCPHCTYASPDTFKLKRHLRTHSGEKPYKCDQCSLCFSQSNSLKAHKLIHNVDQKPVYPCELCPAKCGRKTDLRIHVQKLHTSDKPLKCKRCGKSFPDRYSCKIHNKTHDGEKCFKCDHCPYASTTMRHLKTHLLKHTDEKPYACDSCDQTFRQKQLLRRHQNLYHNPNYVPKPPKEKNHSCPACSRTFAHKGNLMRHLAIHDPDSKHHERALALKLGRQKKVKYIDADALKHPFLSEIKTEGENSNMLKVGVSSSLKRGELVTVSDGDGQQYVVLEVIQLEDGTEQQVAVVAPDFLRATQVQEEDLEYGEEEALEEDEEDEEDRKYKQELMQQQAIERTNDMEKDVVTCFGFDEVEEEEEEEEITTTPAPFTDKLDSSLPSRHSSVFEVCDIEDSEEESGNEEEQEIVYELV